MISRLAGGAQIADDVRRRILQAADGNPLFIEEMLALVSEDEGNGEIVMPPTIQALLQSRLDRLGTGERDLIGRGAVEGQVFHRGTVRELAPEPERADVATHLLSLVRKEMIRPDQPTYPDEEAFRFRHLLIRDAAYDSLPKETRAELHEAFADWLDRHATLIEQDEIVGYHIERAYRNRAELDRADPRLAGLARRAADQLQAAARGARVRGDLSALCGLLHRSIELLPPGDWQRLEAQFDLAYPLISAGRRGEVRVAAGELMSCETPRFRTLSILAETLADVDEGRFEAQRIEDNVLVAREAFSDLEDDFGLAWTEFVQYLVDWMNCRAAAATGAALRAEAHAHAASDARWCADVRGALNEDDLTDAIAADSLEGFLAAVSGLHTEGKRLSDRAVGLAATIDLRRGQRAGVRVARAHARARRQAGRGPRGRRDRGRDLRGQGRRAGHGMGTGAARLALRLTLRHARMAEAIRGARARPG